ncbi:LysM repeat-containing protein [Oceanobacillus limi]|uniref:Autolysin n=1 Tax=Oceanobacillus limi TaxID=930131 RepID=A0A1I0ES80_9BACI|nr:LysM peptidoglycan-binding domain-containing protein [Oceanobacillus limi]SET48221.1 LysM repeat-containing protein [Oceanobacillus limi]
MRKLCSFATAFILMIFLNIPLIHAAGNLYEVRSGDTLPMIAAKYETTIENLKAYNGLQSNNISVGQRLRVPILHEVRIGDTLQEIASTYHSSPRTIKETNKLSSEQLTPGQLLKITPQKLNMNDQDILMTKEEFRDWLFNQKFTREITLIQQHHTWLPSYEHFNGSNHFQMLKGMRNHHVQKMEWKDIAQNITTFPDGKIAVSRPFDQAPEGSIGPKANSIGLAIEHIGNFDIGNDVMTEEHKETIVYITALLCIKFGLTPSIDSITYHHWWHFKTKERVLDDAESHEVKYCPGTAFFGGNSTKSAKKYFYPLIEKKIEEILASK